MRVGVATRAVVTTRVDAATRVRAAIGMRDLPPFTLEVTFEPDLEPFTFEPLTLEPFLAATFVSGLPSGVTGRKPPCAVVGIWRTTAKPIFAMAALRARACSSS